MTTPTLKIKITPAPKLRGKMDVRFPANVEALSPIVLDKSGGNYTFSIDLDEITTGSAAKLTTARNIDGQAFDGTANITVIAPGTHAATGKTTPVDADELPLVDTAASNVLKKLTWANLKATLAAWLVSACWIRERLTASRTYYVRTDGSDSNDGLADTAVGAFLTLQKAWDVVCDSLDLAGQAVTIQLADGTYAGISSQQAPVGGTGMSQVTIKGNASSPQNVVLTTASNTLSFGSQGTSRAQVTLRDFEIRSSGGVGVVVFGASVRISNIRFGTVSSFHVWVSHGGWFEAVGDYAVVGNCTTHMQVEGTAVAAIHGRTVTYANSPTVGINYVANMGGQIYADSMTFVNGATVTGQRFLAQRNGAIYTGSSGSATYFPGSTSGSVISGGIYDVLRGTSGELLYNSSGAVASLASSSVSGSNLTLGGSLGIGTSSLTGYGVRNSKAVTGATTAFASACDGTVSSTVTTIVRGHYSALSTQAASFTLPDMLQFSASQGAIGAGSTVTNQYGFHVGGGLTGATNNYGFYGNLMAATGRWNLYLNGSARNYMAGQLSIGSTTDPGAGNLSVTGAVQTGSFTVATLPAGTTGQIVYCSNCRVFNGAGTQEGAGAGTGGHVTYNGSAWKIAGTNVTAVA